MLRLLGRHVLCILGADFAQNILRAVSVRMRLDQRPDAAPRHQSHRRVRVGNAVDDGMDDELEVIGTVAVGEGLQILLVVLLHLDENPMIDLDDGSRFMMVRSVMLEWCEITKMV